MRCAPRNRYNGVAIVVGPLLARSETSISAKRASDSLASRPDGAHGLADVEVNLQNLLASVSSISSTVKESWSHLDSTLKKRFGNFEQYSKRRFDEAKTVAEADRTQSTTQSAKVDELVSAVAQLKLGIDKIQTEITKVSPCASTICSTRCKARRIRYPWTVEQLILRMPGRSKRNLID